MTTLLNFVNLLLRNAMFSIVCFSLPVFGQTKDYAAVNGLKMYYEIHGTGQPLILIHGGLGSTGMFDANLDSFAKKRQVITVDMQAHGRTADIERPLSLEQMADDVAALIKQLGLKKVDIAGYSMGGCVALQTAIRHPELVAKLAVISAPFKRAGYYPAILAQQEQMGPQAAEFMKQTPMYQSYAAIAPKKENWTALITKMGDLIKKDYDWSADIKKIKVPVLLVFGDADLVPPSHAVEFFQLLGGGQKDGGWDKSGLTNSRLSILPGTTHYEIFRSPLMVAVVTSFLDETIADKK